MSAHVNDTIEALDRLCRLQKFLARLAQEAFEAGNEALYLAYLAIIDAITTTKNRLSSTLETGEPTE